MSNQNNFHPLEVVDRVSETQLQVGEHSNLILTHETCQFNNLAAKGLIEVSVFIADTYITISDVLTRHCNRNA